MLGGVTSVVVTPAGARRHQRQRRALVPGPRPTALVTEPDGKVGEAFVAGDRLYVTSYGFMNGPISYSDDDGATWTETTLPGNESSRSDP